jgi:hypothetical protein
MVLTNQTLMGATRPHAYQQRELSTLLGYMLSFVLPSTDLDPH